MIVIFFVTFFLSSSSSVSISNLTATVLTYFGLSTDPVASEAECIVNSSPQRFYCWVLKNSDADADTEKIRRFFIEYTDNDVNADADVDAEK